MERPSKRSVPKGTGGTNLSLSSTTSESVSTAAFYGYGANFITGNPAALKATKPAAAPADMTFSSSRRPHDTPDMIGAASSIGLSLGFSVEGGTTAALDSEPRRSLCPREKDLPSRSVPSGVWLELRMA